MCVESMTIEEIMANAPARIPPPPPDPHACTPEKLRRAYLDRIAADAPKVGELLAAKCDQLESLTLDQALDLCACVEHSLSVLRR
jgi:hypothetical protein